MGVVDFDSRAAVSSGDINDHVAYLLQLAQPNHARIRAVMARRDLQWHIWCYFDDEPDVLVLTDANRRLSSAMSLPVDIPDLGNVTVVYEQPKKSDED